MSYIKYLLVFSILFSDNVFSCSCQSNFKSYDEAVSKGYANSTVVVSAKAIKTELSKENGSEYQKVEWKVTSSWKGSLKVNDSFSTVTFVGCCMCGHSVEENEKVIFYTSNIEKLSVKKCSIGIESKSQVEQEKVLKRLRENIK